MIYICFSGKTLLPDFFLDEDPEALRQQIEEQGGRPAFGGSSRPQGKGATAQVFKQIESLLGEDLVKSMGGIFQFNLKGTVMTLTVFFIRMSL